MKNKDQQLIWEAYDKWPIMTVLNGIAQGKSPIVIQVDNETLEGVRNKLDIRESVKINEFAAAAAPAAAAASVAPQVIAAVSIGLIGLAAIGLVLYSIKKATENGYEVETHGELPGGTGGTIILKKPDHDVPQIEG
jgi:hypothetical protein